MTGPIQAVAAGDAHRADSQPHIGRPVSRDMEKTT